MEYRGWDDSLVEAVTEEVYAGYEAILDRALAARDVPVPVLVRTLFEFMGGGIENDRPFYRAMFREVGRVNVGLDEGGIAHRARERAVDRIVHLLTRGQARGELAAAADVHDLAIAFDSLVFGTITHWLYDDDSKPLRERMRASAEILLGPEASAAAREYAGPLPDLWIEELPTRVRGRTKP